MDKKYEDSCKSEFNCDDKEFEVTTEDIINAVASEIESGECIGCNLHYLWNIAYLSGKHDLAQESMEFYQDVLEEDIED